MTGQGVKITKGNVISSGASGIATLVKNRKIFIAEEGQTDFDEIMFDLDTDNYDVFIGGNLYTGDLEKSGNKILGYTITLEAQEEGVEIIIQNYTINNAGIRKLRDVFIAEAEQTDFEMTNVDLSNDFDVFIGGNLLADEIQYEVIDSETLRFNEALEEGVEIIVQTYVLI